MPVFDEIRAGVSSDRSQYYMDLSVPFYGYNRWGAKVSQGVRDAFWRQGMQVGLKAAYDCIQAFSESNFTEDLKRFDVPTLIIHGDDDQIVPTAASAQPTSKMVQGSTLKVYPRRGTRINAYRERQVQRGFAEVYRELISGVIAKSIA